MNTTPRSSGKLRSSVPLGTGSSGTWERQCLMNSVSPEGEECSQPWVQLQALSGGPTEKGNPLLVTSFLLFSP